MAKVHIFTLLFVSLHPTLQYFKKIMAENCENISVMKVLLINGSPKANGNTFTALSEVAKTLNEEGIETEIISIGKQAVQGCIACGMCGREGKCTFRDDLYFRVMRAVKDGIDGLIVGSPVYYGVWPNSWTGSTRRRGNADHADAWP